MNNLQLEFPDASSDMNDAVVLSNCQEMLSTFLEELVEKIDYELYQPLNSFIDVRGGLNELVKKIISGQRLIRKFLAKCQLIKVFILCLFLCNISRIACK